MNDNKLECVKNIICSTCLSVNRKLFCINELYRSDIVINFIQIPNTEKICWECKAMLRKIAIFKSNVAQAQAKFNEICINIQTCKIFHVTFPPLSKLIKSNVTFQNIGVVKDIKTEKAMEVEINIKKEIIDNKYDNENEIRPKQIEEIFVEENFINNSQENSSHLPKHEVYIRTKLNYDDVLAQREEKKVNRKYLNGKFKCEKCLDKFSSRCLLDSHLDKHSESWGAFSCEICELRFKSTEEKEKHENEHYDLYTCYKCNFKRNDIATVYRHYKFVHEPQPKFCEICKDTKMTQHKYCVHLKKEVMPACEFCPKKFIDEETLQLHVSKHADLPPLECPVCCATYKGAWALRVHMQRVHETSEDVKFYCGECHVYFERIHVYQTHMKSSVKHGAGHDKKYECTQCDKKFRLRSFLKTHVALIHSKRTEYSCEHCDNVFRQKRGLLHHVKYVHENKSRSRDYTCDICADSFYIKKSLQQHLNSHLGRRPYACDVCGSSFSYSGALYMHKRLKHLNVKQTPKKNKKS